MSKRKIAVFVEGQAEYIFVRDFLMKWYEYDDSKLGVECIGLRAQKRNSLPYSIGSEESENFYLIVNVGNDNSVLSQMKKEAERLINKGYHLILGLRDLYCEQYHKLAEGRVIKPNVSEKIMNASHEVISNDENAQYLHLHFAIMEFESWLLGMDFLHKVDSCLTCDHILKETDIDLNEDPETIYHPTEALKKIYKLICKDYDKHVSDIESIISHLEKAHFQELASSPKCNSFNPFFSDLVGLA
ncbi:DUF4276 family protein [Paludibacter sp. 221]|uniref:DUF4276 family protein n=1 Tax=Paludibacter sp. 221 TaxID=2302939 RepID=UPI0013D2F8DC|nr:DUF4276 family protein [Paludibacter sp. 221]NDV47786.1 DUF4276 family protein [Paludibacter sp. 221]